MPQFDYQQLCHFVLPEQGGLSVETILKRFLYLTPREIRHAKYIPDGIQKNGVSCRTNAVVQTGDTITFRYEQKCPHLSEDQVLPVSGDSAGVRILYEDSDLCVADKPSGMVCHASHGHYSDSLTHAAASLLKTPTAPSELRCIGRLDKDTSGLVLFAKNQLAAARLSRQRESGALKKEYLALVHHPFSEETQKETIRLSMEQIPGDDPDSFDPSGKRITKMRICKEGNGLWATTHYEAVLQDPFWAVVCCRLETGRTHQIRVHLSYLGYPILGDHLYCNGDPFAYRRLHGEQREMPCSTRSAVDRNDDCPRACASAAKDGAARGQGGKEIVSDLIDRQALHAFSLTLTHPVSGETLHLEAPLPADMLAVIAKLKLKE